jgi:hypothetical protein
MTGGAMKGNVLILKDLKKNSEWCDKDHVLLYACFQVLVDFLEKEKPQAIVDYKHNKEQRRQWKELQTLYRYWKIERPRLEREEDRLRNLWAKKYKTKSEPLPNGWIKSVVVKDDKKAFLRLTKHKDRMEKLENEMLHRLVGIRKHLWC